MRRIILTLIIFISLTPTAHAGWFSDWLASWEIPEETPMTFGAAPISSSQRNLLPFEDDKYYLGTTSPSNLRWKGLFLGTGTTTSAGGFDISDGCYAVDGICLVTLRVDCADEEVIKWDAPTGEWICASDITGGGTDSDGDWATSTDSLRLYPDDTQDVVIIGATGTSSPGTIFEVVGASLFDSINASSTANIDGKLTLGTATTTAGNGIDISAGCFAIGGVCVVDTDTNLTEEEVQDFAWNVLGGTQTGITVTYQDGTNDVDFVTDVVSSDLDAYLLQSLYYSTTTHANISSLPALTITESQISDLDHYTTLDFSTDLAGTTTDALSEGSTNLYYTDARVNNVINSSSTIWNNNTEASLEAFLTDVTNVFTNNDGALDDDDLTDDSITTLSDVTSVDDILGTANQLSVSGGADTILNGNATLSLANHVIFPGSFFSPLASTTNATSTNLDITNLLTFDSITGSAWSDFCISITGGAGLCDGVDDTGAGSSEWTDAGAYLIPNDAGEGIIVNGSSTITGQFSFTNATGTQLTITDVFNSGDKISDFAGDGLTVVANALTADLGTSIDLTSEVTGVLPEANGGTGDTDLDDILGTTNEITVTNGANTIIGGDATISLPTTVINDSFIATASSTFSGLLNFTNATGTLLTLSGLTNCDTIDTDANGFLSCGTDSGGTDTFAIIQVDGVAQSTNAPTLDFADADFDLTESPTDDFDITIDASITRDTELDAYLTLTAWYATTTDQLSEGSTNLYNQTHTGEVTGATALTIASNVVDEDNLKVHNAPTNDYILSASSSATGGLEWVATSTARLGLAGLTDLHDAVTLAGQDFLSLSGQEITANPINEDNININAPTNDYVLVASSSATGGWEWVATSTARLGFVQQSDLHDPVTVVDTSTIDLTLTGQQLQADGLYTAGDGLTLTTADFDCDTASGSVFGCLLSADWTTFNNKVSTTSIDTEAELEALLTDVSDVFTNNDGALSDDDLTNNSIEDLSDVATITENFGDLFYWNGTAWADIATSSLAINFSDMVGTVDISGQTNLTANGGIDLIGDNLSFDCSDVEGTGIDCSGELITLDATGDWTGTFDGLEGTAYLDGLHVDGTGFVYPKDGDYHSAPYYVATSSSATSTFAGGVAIGNTTATLPLHVYQDGNGDLLRLGAGLSGYDFQLTGTGILDVQNLGGTTLLQLNDTTNEILVNAVAHLADNNTEITFTDDNVLLSSGGIQFLELDENAATQDEAVFNNTSVDIDFRVEGNNDPYALFVEGSSDYVAIGTSSPRYPLTIQPDTDQQGIAFDSFTNLENTIAWYEDTVAQSLISNDAGSLQMRFATLGTYDMDFQTGGTTRFTVNGNGNVGVATTTPGSIFSIGSLANFTTGTSTFYSSGGIDLAGGCFAINGTCVSGGGGGGGTPGGSDSQIQYNNGGSFGGADLYYLDASDSWGFGSSTPHTGYVTVSGKGLVVEQKASSSVASAGTFSYQTTNDWTGTLTGNTAITIADMPLGQGAYLELCQDGTGSRTVTSWNTDMSGWGGKVKWPGNVQPTLQSGIGECTTFSFKSTVATGTPYIKGTWLAF